MVWKMNNNMKTHASISPMAITSNCSINEWATAFPDKHISSALLGRFYEDALLINMNDAESLRLKRAKDILGNDNLGKGDGNDA
jgi:DNA replication protein DnaC